MENPCDGQDPSLGQKHYPGHRPRRDHGSIDRRLRLGGPAPVPARLGADGAVAGAGLRRRSGGSGQRRSALEDGTFIFLLGMPALYWFIVGLLQGRLLGALVSRPLAWAAGTWGGGSLALIGGFATFGALT